MSTKLLIEITSRYVTDIDIEDQTPEEIIDTWVEDIRSVVPIKKLAQTERSGTIICTLLRNADVLITKEATF